MIWWPQPSTTVPRNCCSQWLEKTQHVPVKVSVKGNVFFGEVKLHDSVWYLKYHRIKKVSQNMSQNMYLNYHYHYCCYYYIHGNIYIYIYPWVLSQNSGVFCGKRAWLAFRDLCASGCVSACFVSLPVRFSVVKTNEENHPQNPPCL